jgi:hypothetical protein
MLFTGSSKPRGAKVRNHPVPHRQRDEEQEEIISPRSTKCQRAAAAAAMKRTTSGPLKRMNDLTKKKFLDIHRVNPYLVEKNHRLCPNTYFYHPNQERI